MCSRSSDTPSDPCFLPRSHRRPCLLGSYILAQPQAVPHTAFAHDYLLGVCDDPSEGLPSPTSWLSAAEGKEGLATAAERRSEPQYCLHGGGHIVVVVYPCGSCSLSPRLLKSAE